MLQCFATSRTAFTSQYRHLPLLNQVAMPFYLTHQQVLFDTRKPSDLI